ncbi:MAG: hypothetical protein RLZZ142_2526 [Verrucomicrobiota bacterium]|jgi:hypothetical protein
MTEEKLQALLRQRAETQAPEGYSQELLRALHRRQREELLRRPLWRIAVERLGTLLSEHSLSAPAYTASLAAVTCAGIVAIVATKPRSVSPAAAAQTMASTSTPLEASQIREIRTVSGGANPELQNAQPKRKTASALPPELGTER